MHCVWRTKKFKDKTRRWCIDTPVNCRNIQKRWNALLVTLGIAAGCLTGCSDKPADAAAGGDANAKPYTLDTCLVSGEKLGSMGEPIVKVYDGQQVKFCCGGCIKDFEKDKQKFLTKIAAAAATPAPAK